MIAANKAVVVAWIASGAVRWLHLGIPCTTYSRARRLDGGPPPIRSPDHMRGVPGISVRDRAKLDLGTALMELSCELIAALPSGSFFTIENPLDSMLWLEPAVIAVTSAPNVARVHLDQCVFGHIAMKPTAIVGSVPGLAVLARRCPGRSTSHSHVALVGRQRDPISGKWAFRTKAAQVYPPILCDAIAACWPAPIADTPGHDGWHPVARAACSVITPPAERKRPLGTATAFAPGRQHGSGARAVGAGYQMRRALVEPLIATEIEPGQVVQLILSQPHPFCVEPPLDPALQFCLSLLISDPVKAVNDRAAAFVFWLAFAESSRVEAIAEIRAIRDAPLRLLYSQGAELRDDAPIGSFVHFPLLRALVREARLPDVTYADELREGLPIVGQIAKSHAWVPIEHHLEIEPESLLERAWEVRHRVKAQALRNAGSEHVAKVWEDTCKDAATGACIGPFATEDQVSAFLGSDQWIPTSRFAVVQGDKVRGVDAATSSCINRASAITEKLELSFIDSLVGAIRHVLRQDPEASLGLWVLDERNAYRQIGVSPLHRCFSVVAMIDPAHGTVAYWFMVGHSFGWVSAVYNYNRRSAIIDGILRSIFLIPSFCFYDDKFGFDRRSSLDATFGHVQGLHAMLGIGFDRHKLQCGPSAAILGVLIDLQSVTASIKPSRRDELLATIEAVLRSDHLEPIAASKLRGKLMFATSQLWSRVGRSMLLALAERQFARGGSRSLNPAIRESLAIWQGLIARGRPRSLRPPSAPTTEVLVFTDGAFPTGRPGDDAPPSIGGVLVRTDAPPVFFSMVVPQDLIDTWLPRKTQIAMIELLAVVVAFDAFAQELRGARAVFLIDAEAVEGAIVKGYSARSDICLLVGRLWQRIADLDVLAYFDRVSTDANLSDGVSRGRVQEALDRGWIRRFPNLPVVGSP